MNKKLLAIVAAFLVVALGIFAVVSMQNNEEPEQIIQVEYTPGEYFVTNVNDSNRLLKVALVLIIDTDEQQETLQRNNSLIRDKIIFILRTLTEEEIRSNDTIPYLRQQIVDELNYSLGISNIVEVRFNDFVMQ